MEEDVTSRRLLKKKFLDRWENEGGKICDDLKKSAEIGSPRERERKVRNLSSEISSARSANPPVGKHVRSGK
jgi:hypothetical protein